MRDMHQHGEIELNSVECGELTYLFGGRALSLGPGQLLVLWGARPHRLIACAPGTRCVILTLPLAAMLRFDLPAPFNDRVLRGTRWLSLFIAPFLLVAFVLSTYSPQAPNASSPGRSPRR